MTLLLTSLIFASCGRSIVNIESLRTGLAEPGEKFAATVSANHKRSTSRDDDFDVIGYLERRTIDWETLLAVEYEFGAVNKIIDTNSKFVHWRNGFFRQRSLYPEVFIQHKYDGVSRLSERSILGGGLRYKVWQKENSNVFLGLGLFHAKEVLEERPLADDHGTTSQVWVNSYLSLKYPLMENINFHHVTYVQPSTKDGSHLRVFSTYQIVSKLNSRLNITLSYEYSYDSKPAQLAVSDSSELSTIFGILY